MASAVSRVLLVGVLALSVLLASQVAAAPSASGDAVELKPGEGAGAPEAAATPTTQTEVVTGTAPMTEEGSDDMVTSSGNPREKRQYVPPVYALPVAAVAPVVLPAYRPVPVYRQPVYRAYPAYRPAYRPAYYG